MTSAAVRVVEPVAGQLSRGVRDAHKLHSGEEFDGAGEAELGVLRQAHDLGVRVEVVQRDDALPAIHVVHVGGGEHVAAAVGHGEVGVLLENFPPFERSARLDGMTLSKTLSNQTPHELVR